MGGCGLYDEFMYFTTFFVSGKIRTYNRITGHLDDQDTSLIRTPNQSGDFTNQEHFTNQESIFASDHIVAYSQFNLVRISGVIWEWADLVINAGLWLADCGERQLRISWASV